MTIGALVTVPELQSEGLAKLTATRGSYSVIRFLASGAEMTQEARNVLRHGLLPGTRVRIRVGETETAGLISERPVQRDQASGLLVYGLRRDDGGETVLREDAVIAVPLPDDPVEQLATVAFNDLKPMFAKAGSVLPAEPWGPQTCAAREELLTWRDAAWQLTGGVVGLAAARVRPLPHQLLAARRALDDRQVRFLLADEVGLGKTIEAGLVVQSLLAIKPDLRVLVVVPGALLSQWFLELHLRFGGRAFVMLDSERLRGWTGNPWDSEQFVLASSRALEELDAKGALRLATSKWDVLVVDECHRMQPGGILYKRVAILSKSTPHVLLLSATPARQHADAYLALLALLQPQVWRLDDLAGFTSRLAAHDRVLDLLTRTMAAEATELPALASAWTTAVPGDPLLATRAEAMAADPAAREALIAYAREHMQLDRRVVRNRRQVLARLSRASGIKDFAATTRSLELVPYTPDAAEQAVRDAIVAYRTVLMDDAGDTLPPRLAHWLTQVELALAAHPQVLERMLAMRAAVLEDPEEFAEYRERARRDETLAQVLRSDLSENEVASHVAISAACNCNPELENTALAALRAAVAAWSKHTSSRPTARLKALIARLKIFWDDQPQEKVLIFTTHGLAVTPLAEALGRAFGEDTVETFGAHQDTVAREESARRFQTDDRCALMVCDPLGGEGRNFQFVSVVTHHDLPWSVAAVEQRIGRVDRLGRDGDIPSWVLACDDPAAVDAAWGTLLDQAVGVFTASSSGLEFVSDAVETTALRAALSGGGVAVRAAIPTAAALVTREREARDQREDDCFHADAATYADAGRESEAVAAATAPAGAVARWIRSMGGEVRRDEERPRPWKLRTRYHDQPEEGVYDRESALTHSHLAFFGIGHRLIDKLIDDAASARWCRATAWRRPAPTGVSAWSGVRAVFTLVPDLAPLAASGLRLEVLRRLFTATPPLRLIVCARAQDGAVETAESVLAALRAPFSAKAGDAALSAGVNRDSWVRPLLAGQSDKITAWQDGVRRAATATQAWAAARLDSDRTTMHAALAARLDPGLAAARASASANTARFGANHAETKRAISEAENEERQVTALQAAIAGARFDLEQIAYVALV